MGPATPNDPAYWDNHLRGKYLSSWPMLCYAAAGNLALATETLSQVLQKFRDATARGDLDTIPAHVYMDVQIQYNALAIGPLLGAIILSEFAIESFLWLVASSKLCESYSGDELDAQLRRLDKKSLPRRLRAILHSIGVSPPPSDLVEAIEEFVRYRNFCAHDTPQVYGNALGQMLKFKRDKTAPTPDQRFPLPADQPLPLSLGEALSAAKAHDRLVQWVSQAADPLLDRHHLLGRKWSILEQLALVRIPLDKIQQIDDAWDRELRAFVANVTLEQLQRFHNDLWGEGGFFNH
jgi:hypothetical protein